MKANVLIATAGVFVLACLHLAHAQQSNTPRVGFISSTGTPGDLLSQSDAFWDGLRDLGYVDGKNIIIVNRYAEGRLDRMPLFVREFVQQKVDVIVGVNNVVIRAAKETTKTIPIVMISSVDSVAAGYVASFARPGGNITGIANLSRDLSGKRVDLLKEMLPKISRVAVLWDADGPGPLVAVKEYQAAANRFKLKLQSLQLHGPDPDITRAFRDAKAAHAEALIVIGNPLVSEHRTSIFALATKHRLPTMTESGHYVDSGGLISYGANRADLYRRAAGYVVEVVKGARPHDLPVTVPAKFEIFINLKTARHLGIAIPQHLLIQADKVIR